MGGGIAGFEEGLEMEMSRNVRWETAMFDESSMKRRS